jgi:8-hydroxy-5-deazaflavin:NADPH oxidoreductase
MKEVSSWSAVRIPQMQQAQKGDTKMTTTTTKDAAQGALQQNGKQHDLKIGIIGAGEIGGTLVRRFSQLGYQVSVANAHGPESLAGLARETGAKAVTPREAARAGKLVIVTIPEGKIPNLAKDLFAGVSSDVIVVDTGNYYPQQRDGRIEGIERGMLESRWVESQIGRSVVKAFNTMNYQRLLRNGRPKGTPGRVAIPVAGDDQRAKQVVMRLIDELGFDPIDSGSLNDSWRQQPGTPVYDIDRDAAGVQRALAEAKPERLPEWRASANSPVSSARSM